MISGRVVYKSKGWMEGGLVETSWSRWLLRGLTAQYKGLVPDHGGHAAGTGLEHAKRVIDTSGTTFRRFLVCIMR
jgi:hypothetical protein